jgi:hypothetical protein
MLERWRRPIALVGAVGLLLSISTVSSAGSNRILDSMSDFFRAESPGYLQATFDTGTFVTEDYAQIQQGFQLEQSVNEYLGVVCRVGAFQIFQNHINSGTILLQDADKDLSVLFPLGSPSAQLFFGRFQAGLNFYLTSDTNLQLSGGSDVGDDSSPLVEADLNSWLFVHSLHPLQLSLSSIYTFQDNNSSNSISVDTVARSTASWLLMAGVGGAIFNSSFVSGVNGRTTSLPEGEPQPVTVTVSSGAGSLGGQGGVDLNAIYRPWQSALGIQMGYGTSGIYGEIALSKQIGFLD